MWGNELTAPDRITHTLAVPNLALRSEPAILRVALQGYTDDRAVNPDHHIRLWWNARLVHETLIDGQGVHLLKADLPAGGLVEGDVLPDVLLGRISASQASQVATVVDKILRFEAMPMEDDWRKRAVLVADDDGALEFEAASERLATAMPPDADVRRFYAGSYPRDRTLSADIRAAVDGGAFALNFNGHGNVALWSPWPGGGLIFDINNIRELRNGDRMPVFTTGTCMNGWIDHPFKPVSMTEQWLTHAPVWLPFVETHRPNAR
jgi:hypothetical protein